MKISFYRWMAKNQRAARILFSSFLIIAYTVLLYIILDWHLLPVIILDLFLWFMTLCYVSSASNMLIKKPMKELSDNCDPYPFLKETEAILEYDKANKVTDPAHIINYCAALSETGEYQKAIDILNTVNIDKYALLNLKAVYYHNLSSAYHELEKYEVADIFFNRALQVYSDMRNDKIKRSLDNNMIALKADHYFRLGEYQKTLDILDLPAASTKIQNVSRAFSCALAYIKLNDLDNAKAKLLFVVENGNKLYVAAQAKRLLDELNSKA